MIRLLQGLMKLLLLRVIPRAHLDNMAAVVVYYRGSLRRVHRDLRGQFGRGRGFGQLRLRKRRGLNVGAGRRLGVGAKDAKR